MRNFFLLLTSLALVACSQYNPPAPALYDQPAGEDPSSVAASSSEQAMTTDVLFDGEASAAEGKTGMDWLRAIQTKRIYGNVGNAKLHITVDSKYAAVGVYIANVAVSKNGNGYPDERFFGTHLHFIDAVWSGDGHRHLAEHSNFGVRQPHALTFTYNLAALPMTRGDDGSSTASVTENLLSSLNADDLYLGFTTAGYKGHLKVTLEHDGELNATSL